MTSGITREQVSLNYQAVRERVQRAAERAGRNAEEVTIVGVTKYVEAQETEWLVDAGCHHLGESRPQLLWKKADELRARDLKWHLIGHLQRNKVAKTLPLVDTIHSVDSIRLLNEILKEAACLFEGQTLKLLMEVNVTSDRTKTGMLPDEAKLLLEHWCNLVRSGSASKSVQITGLMGMSSLEGDESVTRQEFDSVRLLRDQLCQEFAVELPTLSMGMSGDFEWAIESGSTIIRVGSVLFA